MQTRLICLETNEHIIINKPTFFIGRERAYVDHCILDATISRVHCKLCYKDNGWYLTDCNSTNATYLNGNRVLPNAEFVLKDGDEIRLANIRFRHEEV